MGCLSVGRLLAGFEAWITGYRSEHYRVGLQMVGAAAWQHAAARRLLLGVVWRASVDCMWDFPLLTAWPSVRIRRQQGTGC